MDWAPGDENASVMLETVRILLRRLRDLSRGKGMEVERRDDPWDCLNRLGQMLKKSEAVRVGVGGEEIIQR